MRRATLRVGLCLCLLMSLGCLPIASSAPRAPHGHSERSSVSGFGRLFSWALEALLLSEHEPAQAEQKVLKGILVPIESGTKEDILLQLVHDASSDPDLTNRVASIEGVRVLDSAQKRDLDEFIRSQDPNADTDFATEVQMFSPWLSAKKNATDSNRKEFESSFFLNGKTVREFYSNLNLHDAKYNILAHQQLIKENPALQGLGLEGWRFDTSDISGLGKILKALSTPIPGDSPELVYFLNPKNKSESPEIADMTSAWQAGGREPPAFLNHDDIDHFLEGHTGKTLFLVGHILGPDFILDRGKLAPLHLNIGQLIKAAIQHHVVLFPLGCNSASSGAPFGFTRSIEILEIAQALNAIPSGRPTLGDLLAALGKIGTPAIRIEPFSDQLNIVIQSQIPRQQTQNGWIGIPISITLIAPSLLQTQTCLNGELCDYAHNLNQRAEQLRPFADSGWRATWRRAYRLSPNVTLFYTSLVSFAAWFISSIVHTIFDQPTRKPAVTLNRIQYLCLSVAAILTISWLIHVIYDYWEILLGLFVGLVVLGVLGAIFGEKTEKHEQA